MLLLYDFDVIGWCMWFDVFGILFKLCVQDCWFEDYNFVLVVVEVGFGVVFVCMLFVDVYLQCSVFVCVSCYEVDLLFSYYFVYVKGENWLEVFVLMECMVKVLWQCVCCGLCRWVLWFVCFVCFVVIVKLL